MATALPGDFWVPDLVIAIDFGTYASGYAFQFQSEYKSNKLEINFPTTWTQGKGNLYSYKTPTCLLLKPDQSFAAFGHRAMKKLLELEDDENPQDWYLFKYFKMVLHNKNDLHEKTPVEAENGKTLPAIQVFSESIRFMKEHFIKDMGIRGTKYQEQITRWVITVPAIWDEPAKQLMRRAAELAGIQSKNLVLALEPEAAAVFCTNIPESQLRIQVQEKTINVAKPGSKILVVDMGGGTVDITAMEVHDDKSMNQLFEANGGDWGGMNVDKNFEKLMATVATEIAWNEFIYSNNIEVKMDDMDMRDEFEAVKREMDPEMDSKGASRFRVKLPKRLKELMESSGKKELKKILETSDVPVTLSHGRLVFESKIFFDLYKDIINNIIDHLKQILGQFKATKLDAVVLVGGFAESNLVVHRLRDGLKGLLPVVRPQSPSQAVLKGAVMYGHHPEVIRVRVLRFHYGVAMSMKCEKGEHPHDKEFQDENGQYYANDIFRSHARKGRQFRFNEWITKEYHPMEDEQKSATICFYASDAENAPKYVTDDRCRYLGPLEIEFSTPPTGKEKTINVSMCFGGTEIKAKATDKYDPEKTFEPKFKFVY